MTTRRLMVVVLVVAGLLGLARAIGAFALVPCLVGLVLAGIGWPLFRGHRRRALRFFVASAVAAIASVAALGAFLMSIGGFVLMYLVALLAVPAILSPGAAWAALATRNDASPRRSPMVAWPLVFALAFAPMAMMFTDWPLRLAFLASRPALERLADRVEAGQAVRRPEWAGLYRVVGSAIDPATGNVGLVIAPDPAGRSGFVRLGPGRPPPAHSGPFFNFNFDVPLGGRWFYQDED